MIPLKDDDKKKLVLLFKLLIFFEPEKQSINAFLFLLFPKNN